MVRRKREYLVAGKFIFEEEMVSILLTGVDRMLARLSMLLDTKDIDYRKASLLQGVLLERLDTNYVDFLHQQQMHPYSQYVSRTDKGVVWQIQTLNKEAYEQIIVRFMNSPLDFELRHNGLRFAAMDQRLETIAISDLMAPFYNEQAVRSMTMDILTPTAFRQNGHYVILPDIRLICQNLMQRFSVVSGNMDMMDHEALAQIEDNTFVSKHRIQSRLFPLEGHSLPGFCGSVTLRCQGTETMVRYLRMLLNFGEFAGVGIKTAVGMGAMRLRRD